VPTWALGTKLVPKAHVGTKFCNYSLVLQDHFSTSDISSPIFSNMALKF
jgi:hypothetical protein